MADVIVVVICISILGGFVVLTKPSLRLTFWVGCGIFAFLIFWFNPTNMERAERAFRLKEWDSAVQLLSSVSADSADYHRAQELLSIAEKHHYSERLARAIAASEVGDADTIRELLADFPQDHPEFAKAKQLFDEANATSADRLLDLAQIDVNEKKNEAALEKVMIARGLLPKGHSLLEKAKEIEDQAAYKD